jgi:hypothetical protein
LVGCDVIVPVRVGCGVGRTRLVGGFDGRGTRLGVGISVIVSRHGKDSKQLFVV